VLPGRPLSGVLIVLPGRPLSGALASARTAINRDRQL
jgi:hypothetical protein